MKKNILIGISGGIACYKIASLVNYLNNTDYNVNVVMTQHATNFVAPLTFETLSHNKVVVDMFEKDLNTTVKHIELAQNADVFVIAPATANIIGKIANGIADDMLSTCVLATKAPVIVAPAMNCNMYENKIVQNNIEKLKNFGYTIIDSEYGKLACGDYGKGKLADIKKISSVIEEILGDKNEEN